MTATYEPGQVAVATVRGVPNIRVFKYSDSMWSHVWDGERCSVRAADLTDVRPLIVLDPKRVPTPGFLLLAAKVMDDGRSGYEAESADLRSLATEIAAQTKPPRIPEPGFIGSRVMAAQVGEVEGSERGWTKFRKDGWIDVLDHIRSWDDLENPVLIRDGVEDGAS